MVKMYLISKLRKQYQFNVNNDYQQNPRVPNKPFGSLLEISPTNHIFLKTFNPEYDEIKLWFTDQNSKPLGIEDKINLTMIVK